MWDGAEWLSRLSIVFLSMMAIVLFFKYEEVLSGRTDHSGYIVRYIKSDLFLQSISDFYNSVLVAGAPTISIGQSGIV